MIKQRNTFVGAIAVIGLASIIIICSPKKNYVCLPVVKQHTWIQPNSFIGQVQDKPFSGHIISTKEEYKKWIEPHKKVISSYHFTAFDNLDMSKYSILLISSSNPFYGIDEIRNQFSDTLYVTLGKAKKPMQGQFRTYAMACIAGKLYGRAAIVEKEN